MKLKTKIIIDRFIGKPFVYLLNVLARVLGKLLNINHQLNEVPKEIVICKFIGLGSIIQATPLIQTLKANFPSSKLTFLTTAGNKSMFEFIPEIDEVYCIADKNLWSVFTSSISILFKCWKKRPDVYIDLEIYSNFSSAFSVLSISKNRLGYFKNDKMYRKGIYTHLLYFNALAPISQSYLQFARLLHIKNEIETLKLTYITPDKLNSPSNDYIIINPNASDLRLERRWDIAHFASLINSITQQHSTITVVLIGSANEKKYVQQLYSLLTNTQNVMDTSGTLNLNQLVGWIKHSKLVITNDTGPMHIAFALNVNTVSLFGPCSPLQYGHTKNNISFYKKMYCSPCVHDFLVPPCLGDNQCMKKIMPNDVFEEVNKIISNQFIIPSALISTPNIDYKHSDSSPLGFIKSN